MKLSIVKTLIKSITYGNAIELVLFLAAVLGAITKRLRLVDAVKHSSHRILTTMIELV